VTVAGVVMAHEKRAAWAEELSDRLGLPITWDKVNDRHETGLRCLQAGLDSDATHWLVVQDDSVPCGDLLDGVAKATEFSGDRIVGLYVGNVRPETRGLQQQINHARATGTSWLALPGPWWGVGIAIPTGHLPALVAHYGKSREQNYDRRIERWARAAGVECWYTMPSLVDHRHGAENPSLVPKRNSPDRHARWFIGADQSALDVDWSRVPLTSRWWRDTRTNRVMRAEPGSPQARRFLESSRWEPVVEHACESCGGKGKWYEPVDGVA
jgi:hypothetical protein